MVSRTCFENRSRVYSAAGSIPVSSAMKIKKTEYGVELVPENDHEKECLKHIMGKGPLSAKHEDVWDQKGPVKIQFKPHPWDK